MKIRKELIGAKVYHAILNQNILIEEGNEEKYEKLGMDVFEKRQVPKLQKNAKNKKKRIDNDSDNSNRPNDSSES